MALIFPQLLLDVDVLTEGGAISILFRHYSVVPTSLSSLFGHLEEEEEVYNVPLLQVGDNQQ